MIIIPLNGQLLDQGGQRENQRLQDRPSPRLDENREIYTSTAAKVAEQIIFYVETSAKTLKSTRVAFDQLVTQILKRDFCAVSRG